MDEDIKGVKSINNTGQTVLQNQISNKTMAIYRRKWFFIVVVLTLVLICFFGIYLYKKYSNNSTLPYPISQNTAGLLGYDIYYPNQKLLPAGYILNMNSFTDSDQAIIYSVSYGDGKKVIFSDQAKPSANELQNFYARNMPINTTLQTRVGVAKIGAINGQSVVSLPTNTNAWLLITAPGNIDQSQLSQVAKSVQLSK